MCDFIKIGFLNVEQISERQLLTKGRLGRIRALKQVLSYEFSSLDLVIFSFLFSRSVRGVIHSFYSNSIPQPGWGSASRYNKEKALCLDSIPKELIVIRRRTFLLASSE